MNIRKVTIKNFYSIRDATINFSSYKGINFIKGHNKDTRGSNGAGKSIFFESVIWGLTGRTIRPSKDEALINESAGRDCSVTILFDDGHKIERKKRPSRLKFSFKGTDLSQNSAPETQKHIETVLGVTYNQLIYSCVFGQHNDLEFLTSSPEKKRDLLNKILKIDSILEYRSISNSKKRAVMGDIKALTNTLESQQKDLDSLRNKLCILEKSNDLDYTLEEVIIARSKRESIEKELSEAQREYNELKPQIDKVKTIVDHGVYCEIVDCPTCGAEEAIKDEVTPHQHRKAKVQLENLYKVKAELQEKVKKAKKYLLETKDINPELYEKIITYRSEKDSFNAKIQYIIEKIKENQETLERLSLKEGLYKYWERAFSENGLIRFIIRGILEEFNKLVNYYIGLICSEGYSVTFDDSLNETLLRDGKTVFYISLSGGERKRLNLAIMLALLDLGSSTSRMNLNFIFFDECTESLDEPSLSGLYSLLQELKKKRKVFVITHNYTMQSLLEEENVINIVKQQGITEIK